MLCSFLERKLTDIRERIVLEQGAAGACACKRSATREPGKSLPPGPRRMHAGPLPVRAGASTAKRKDTFPRGSQPRVRPCSPASEDVDSTEHGPTHPAGCLPQRRARARHPAGAFTPYPWGQLSFAYSSHCQHWSTEFLPRASEGRRPPTLPWDTAGLPHWAGADAGRQGPQLWAGVSFSPSGSPRPQAGPADCGFLAWC